MRKRRLLTKQKIIEEFKNEGYKEMALPKFSKMTWSIITGFVVVLSLVGGIWKFDDRYAKADDLLKTRETIETQTVQTFEAFQQKQDTINDGLRLDLLNLEYERAREELRELRDELRNNPDDTDLEIQIDELKQRIDEINAKRKELRDKLLGVN